MKNNMTKMLSVISRYFFFCWLAVWMLFGQGKCVVKKKVQQIDPVLVLLPWTPQDIPTQQVSFTLKAYGGCFKWSSQRPDLVSVKEEVFNQQECSTSAVITPCAKSFQGGRAWVIARDKETGAELRCEVHVAAIANITIDSSARSIGVDTVETLTIRAVDNHGNVFSSLEGLWFAWQSSRLDVLNFASFHSDIYRASQTRQALQELGGQSDMVLVKGLSSGESKVTARLLSSSYQHIHPAVIHLGVSEQLMIEPPFLRTIPYAMIHYHLRVLKPQIAIHKSPLVDLPSIHFRWKAEMVNGSRVKGKVEMDESKAIVYARTTDSCEAKIKVTDQRVFNYVDEGRLIITHLANFQFFYQENMTHLQQSKEWMRFDANVSNPLSFVQQASPFVTVGSKSHWYFIKNRLYLLGVYGLCKEGKLLYLPSNLHIVLSCGKDGEVNDVFTLQEGKNCMGLQIVHVSKTRQYVLVRATNITTGTIQVEAPIVPQNPPNAVMTNSIRNHQKYHITYPLLVSFTHNKKHSIQHILNNVVVLPIHHEWTFKAFGGSGAYVWFNSNHTVARIQALSNTSAHLTTTNALGWTQIQVVDAENPSNHYTFFVAVSSLKYLVMDPMYDKIPIETKANIRLRGVSNAVHCSKKSPCPDALQKWNAKVHSLQISDGIPFVEGDSNTLLSLHYLNCSALDKSVASPFQVDITRSDSAHPIAWDIQQQLLQDFVCGEIQFHVPSESTSLKVKVALTKKWTSTRWLHIYSPLSALVHTSYTFWKNSTHIINPITTETPPLTVAVGSWVDIQIQGGPTMTSQDAVKTHVTLDQHGSNYGKVQVVPDSNDLIRFFCVDATNQTNANLMISRKSHSTLSQKISLMQSNASKIQLEELQKDSFILYRIVPAKSETNLYIRCSFPSRVEIHAIPSFVKSSTWKHFTERYIVSQASKAMPIEYCQCGIQHTFGLFVYGDDNTLINFWSSSYTTQWKLQNEYLKKLTHPSIRYVTMDLAACHKTFTLTSFFHFNFTAWETAFGTQSNDKPGLKDLAKRVTHYIGNRFSSQREFPSLMFQLSLRGVSPLQMIPFNALGFHIFYHDTNCVRRIQVRFGSGVYRVRFTHRDKLDIFFGKAIFHSPKKLLQKSYSLKKNQKTSSWPYECQEKIVHASTDSANEESLPLKYFNAEEYENCPVFFNNTHDRCLPLQTTQIDLFDNFFQESQENELNRNLLNDTDISQHLYQWDIYVKPKQHVSPFSFSMMIYDAKLLGMKEINMKYAFSALGKLRIDTNCSVYRFQSHRHEKINFEFLSTIKRNIVLEASKKTIHVDVHDIVEFSIQAFDAEHDIEFLPEDIKLMRICLTVTSGQDHTKLSCINKEIVPFSPWRKEDDLWAIVLKQTNHSLFKTTNSLGQPKKSLSFLHFQGRKSGVYTVQAVGYNGKSSTVSSEMVTVVVSDPLILVPSKLILMPGYHTFEIKANGQQNGRPTNEKKFHITNLSITSLLAEKSSNVVTGKWIESRATENILKNDSRSLLQITTGTCIGHATIRVTETDTSITSFIQREVTANVIVAVPHTLHISNTHLESPVYPAAVLKLRAYNSHTLKAIFFTKDNQPFTLSHHYLTSSSLSNKTETEENMNGCTCKWESSRSDVLRFVNDIEKSLYSNLSTTDIGVAKPEGRGLFFVNVFPLTHQLHSPVNVVVHVQCHCNAYVSNQKHSTEIWRHTYNANIQVEIVPDLNAMIYPTFMEAYFSEKDLTHPFIHRYPYRFQILRLVSYGHYTLKVPSNFVSARLEVKPQPAYPIAAVTFFPQTSSVSIKIFVENTQAFRVILHLLHDQSMFYDDVALQVKVLRPISLTVTPKMPTLHVASTVTLYPLLKDEFGNPLLFPTNFQLVTQASHSSVIEENVQLQEAHSQFGSPSISVVGRRQGCSGLTISVQRQELDSKVVKVDSCAVRICVDVSLYPSSAYVLGGGIVHSVFAPQSSVYHTIKPEFQLRFLLKSSVVAWAWLAHASPACVASLEKVLEDNQFSVSLKFHSSLIKWLESRQAYFTYPSCDKVSHDLMQSWIRERIDAFLLENLLFHKNEAIHFKKQEAILRVLKSTNPMMTPSLEDAVYCYTLTFTSDKPFRSTAYLKWIVSKVSSGVNTILKYSIKTKESTHSLHDHISWSNGGILFGNGLQRLTTDTSILHSKSTTLKQTSLQLDSADIVTSSQSGTFRIPLQDSLQSPFFYLNVVNEIASTCILTVWSDDLFQNGMNPFFKQANTNGSIYHTHCLDTKTTTSKTFQKALFLQEKPLTVIFLPYATSNNEDQKLVVSNPFVSQQVKVVCDIHQHPFFNVVPVYGIPLSALGLQAHTTVGCRLFPKYHLVSRAASELILTVKLKGQFSISTHFSLIWRLSWGMIVEQNSMVFSSVTILPTPLQHTIQTVIKRKGIPVTKVIQLPKDSSNPISFHVVTGETCVLAANVEEPFKVSVRLEDLGSNKTRVHLHRLTKELSSNYSGVSVVNTVGKVSNDCRQGCLTWLLLQCGSYSTYIPIYLPLDKKTNVFFGSSLLTKWMAFFNYWDVLFKIVLSLLFVVIATFIHCMRSSRTSLDVRTQTGSALLNRVGPATVSTPYRQWNHNKQIAIGGFAAQSPSSGYRNSVKRPYDPFT